MKVLWVIALWVASWPVVAADPDIAQCILCHGANANGNAAIRAPKLAGMDRWYLQRQLVAFRSGERGTHANDVNGSEMRTIALSLREADIVSVVSQVASLKSMAPPVTVSGDAARGASLFSACASCHGARGEGNVALNAPSLRTNDWYIAAQLNNYRAGLRGVDASATEAQMRAIALTLPDDRAIIDVTAYINTLR